MEIPNSMSMAVPLTFRIPCLVCVSKIQYCGLTLLAYRILQTLISKVFKGPWASVNPAKGQHLENSDFSRTEFLDILKTNRTLRKQNKLLNLSYFLISKTKLQLTDIKWQGLVGTRFLRKKKKKTSKRSKQCSVNVSLEHSKKLKGS